MTDLTEALRQFDATETNVKRLEDLWKQIEKLIPSGLSIDTGSPEALRYAELCRIFRHIRTAVPKLDGFELTDDLMDLDAIFMNRMDAKEIGEISCEINVEREIYNQAETLSDYRFRFSAQRRALVRSALEKAIRDVDELLAALAPPEEQRAADKLDGVQWQSLKDRIAEIDVLKGTSINTPPRWSDLHRHLAFGMVQDLRDIIGMDWPAAKPVIEATLYGPTDPIPVAVPDLAALVKAAPTGPIVTALKWEAIDAAAFERLVFNLVSQAKGYSNPKWLMHTNAPDRGRDISVERTVTDQLTGTHVYRVIVQCKHWRSKSIGIAEVTSLIAQMESWEPPKVDELIITTTGKFTADAVAWIETRNNERKSPRVAMWPDSHLESLLAERIRTAVDGAYRPQRATTTMKKPKTGSHEAKGRDSPSRLINARIKQPSDWRAKMLTRIRVLIEQVDPDVVEDVKWRKPSNAMAGVPVWSHAGIICTGETYKSVVKMTFAKGASLADPAGLFNSSLEGATRRAIDFHEGDKINEKALKALIRAAVALNTASAGS